jgi:tRNA nucleotidyltransferase (CCA-adding enzyme)
MKTYLVGGAVRDKFLGLDAKDNDWVIVGSTPSELQKLGYKPILASFPVFLHPTTNEEYALARTERKVSKGYHGFEVCFAITTTLEEDLVRRDLTINSIATDEHGKIIDPFNGQNDLQNRILRHTSISFKEDPLRIIRLARFMAQLHDFNFTIAEDTKLLAKEILDSGELSHLTKERLNIEFKKALNHPNVFFDTLNMLGCLDTVFPKISENINKISQQSFFTNSLYKAATIEEKIALIFYDFNADQISQIKNELNLSNNHYKLAITISEIHRLTTNTPKAEEIFHSFRKTNILRDRALFEKSFNLYRKLATILDKKNLINELVKIELIIASIQEMDIKILIKNIPNHLIAQTINKLYLDTINKLLKI